MMTKDEFYNKFKNQEDLDNPEVSWLFMNNYSMMANKVAIISGHIEIKKDILYYPYGKEIWKVDLTKSSAISSVHSLREVCQMVLSSKEKKCNTLSNHRTYTIQYRNKGTVKGQVTLNLVDFGETIVLKGTPTIKKLTETSSKDIDTRVNGDFDNMFDKFNKYMLLQEKKFKGDNLDIFYNKCKNGLAIDTKIKKIKNSSDLQKEDLVELMGYCFMTIKEKGWENIL